ncbi:MAG: peptidyl-alpha-hydroxyglycine alpha-amidating lyase family protein [Gemmatimonadales bacterium]
MSYLGRVTGTFGIVSIVTISVFGVAHAQNSAPNPYRTVAGVWGKLPQGRTWGSTSAVFPARDGSGNIWVAERCGQNSCAGKDAVDPILLFDRSGKLLKSFGAGLIVMPHGIHVDKGGNVWVTDTGRENGKGYQVFKFSPDGDLLMALGTPGGTGDGPDSFNGPSDVLVAPNGDIFVAVGHLGRGDDNRIVKFSSDGKFIKSWGKTGSGNDEFEDPHALAMDSQGRLFVGDRHNNRVQIFDQDGNYIATWTQFGRPSGLFIDRNDILYSADSESNTRRNPGWKRGIRIGSIKDGFVTAFIPDPEPDPDHSGTSGAEGVAADAAGNVYGAEVGPKMLRKYVKK